MRLTDAELETLLDQINAPAETREAAKRRRDAGRLTYPDLEDLTGIRANTLEVKVHRLRRKRNAEERAARPVVYPVPPHPRARTHSLSRYGLDRNGTVNRDHGPLLSKNRYTGEWEEIRLHPTLP